MHVYCNALSTQTRPRQLFLPESVVIVTCQQVAKVLHTLHCACHVQLNSGAVFYWLLVQCLDGVSHRSKRTI